jgi:hypothetical protein
MEGAEFEGYIAAIRFNEDNLIQMVLDNGKLKLPDGRLLTGDFSIQYRERWKYTYYEIVPGAQIPFTQEPMLFYGTISYFSGMSAISPPVISGLAEYGKEFDNTTTQMMNQGDMVWAVEDKYMQMQNVDD